MKRERAEKISKKRTLLLFFLFFILLSFLSLPLFILSNHDSVHHPANVKSPDVLGSSTQAVSVAPTGTTPACAQVQFYCLGSNGTCNVPDPCPTASVNNKLVVHFDFDKYDIRTQDMPALDQLAQSLKSDPNLVVTIDGYTDSTGAQTYNDTLSLKRAQVVENYLKSKGATANKYTVHARGDSDPVAPNTNPDGTDNPIGRAQNRRAEILTNQIQNVVVSPTAAPVVTKKAVPTTSSAKATTAPTAAPGSTAYIAASSNNCGNSGYTKYINMTPPKKNFGDPKCNFNKNALYTLLKKLDAKYASEWYLTIVPGESGYNPNAFASPSNAVQCSLDCGGAWGLFQMGSSSPPEKAPPAPGKNGVYDRGDVNWQVQATNAVNYNKKVLKCSFRYWATARAIWGKQSC